MFSNREWMRIRPRPVLIFPTTIPMSVIHAGHYLTVKVTGILTGCTLELELVAVTVSV